MRQKTESRNVGLQKALESFLSRVQSGSVEWSVSWSQAFSCKTPGMTQEANREKVACGAPNVSTVESITLRLARADIPGKKEKCPKVYQNQVTPDSL